MADKTEVINITEFAGASDRKGNDCWKLKASVPWSDYPIEYFEWPRVNGESAFQLGQYRVEFNRGNAFRNKQGSDRDYDYYWNPISMNYVGAAEEQPSGPGPSPTPSNNGGQPSGFRASGGSSAADERKDRSVALSYAKDAWCAGKIERAELIELAGLFHDAMVNGFTTEEE